MMIKHDMFDAQLRLLDRAIVFFDGKKDLADSIPMAYSHLTKCFNKKYRLNQKNWDGLMSAVRNRIEAKAENWDQTNVHLLKDLLESYYEFGGEIEKIASKTMTKKSKDNYSVFDSNKVLLTWDGQKLLVYEDLKNEK